MEQNNEEFSAVQLAALLEAAGLTAAFKNGSLTHEDQERLEAWLAQDDLHRQWFEHWTHSPELPEMQNVYARWEEETPIAYASFRRKYISPATPVYRVPFVRRWGWAAAAVILIIGAVVAITVSSNRRSLPSAHITNPAEILPGKNGAVLTLADGSQVSLDTFKNTTIALQGGVTAKVVNGALIYEGKGDAVGYNTMSTPKGRQFRLTLPDGTQVWLNAASSIRYPTTFTGNQRQVEITGEAYFEVAKNERLPFLVNVNRQMDIRVLGTHFNVAAYENEPGIYATLLEGRIQLLRANTSVVLKPGQQARLLHSDTSGKLQVLENVNQDKVTAWKDGYFNFQGLTYEEIMRQLERWYNIQVVIGKNVRQRSIGGEMTKDVSLDGVLDYFTDLGIHYRLEGRTLTILP